MCCRTLVQPVLPDVASAILAVGLFVPSPGAHHWRREIPEEGTFVTAQFDADGFSLGLSPSIASLEGHFGKRIAASIMYEIACKYAEKVDGVITQTSINVPSCLAFGSTRTLASYPSRHFDFAALCPGFQAVFLGEL